MKILDILNSAWAIDLQTLRDMQETYLYHLRREKIDFTALAGSVEKNSEFYALKNNIAVIPIHGVLTPGNSFFTYFFGGTSYKTIQLAIHKAEGDTQVEKILLYIDSPGGTVKGAFETAAIIRSSSKPAYTWSDGQLTSAAMLLAAPTKEIRITGKTNPVGSIGVIATHVDHSKADERYGMSVTEIVSGKYKNITSDIKPLSTEGKKYLQEEVDYLFTLFADDLAQDRGLAIKTIVDWQAKIFIGQQAIDVGLVDGVATMSEYLAELSTGKIKSPVVVGGGSTQTKTNTKKETMAELTVQTLQTDHPALYQVVFDAGKKHGIEEASKTENQAGIDQERARILAITAAALPGQEELMQKCISEGISAGDAAIRFLAAERQHLKVQAQALADEKPKPVPVDNPANVAVPDPKKTGDNLPLDQQAKANWDKDQALQAEFLGDYASYLAYVKAEQSGQAKILRK
jgi:signal peptide peptidase SppA